eukprot:m.123305 g.123305  ORF g.123305 m.123305 type:complete len:706 (+) comp15567_c0_seq1:118-2235(+)
MSFRRFSRRLKRWFGTRDLLTVAGLQRLYIVSVPTEVEEREDALTRSMQRIERQFGAQARVINASPHDVRTSLPVRDVGSRSDFRTLQHAPALETTLMVCMLVRHWLRTDPESVVCVIVDETHAPCIGCCIELVFRKKDYIEDHVLAGEYHNLCRTLSRHGEALKEIPCHLAFLERVAKHFSLLSGEGMVMAPGTDMLQRPPILREVWKIKEIIMHGIPKVSSRLRPMVMVIKGNNVAYNSMTAPGGIRAVSSGAKFCSFPVNIRVAGDCLVRLYHVPEGQPGKVIGTFTFSTAFFEPLAATTAACPTYRAHLRDIVTDNEAIFPQNFLVDIVFAKINPDGEDEAVAQEDQESRRQRQTSQDQSPTSDALHHSDMDAEGTEGESHSRCMRRSRLSFSPRSEDENARRSDDDQDGEHFQGNRSQHSDAALSHNTPSAEDLRSFNVDVDNDEVEVAILDDTPVSMSMTEEQEAQWQQESSMSQDPSSSSAQQQPMSDEEYARQLQAQFDAEDRLLRSRQRLHRAQIAEQALQTEDLHSVELPPGRHRHRLRLREGRRAPPPHAAGRDAPDIPSLLANMIQQRRAAHHQENGAEQPDPRSAAMRLELRALMEMFAELGIPAGFQDESLGMVSRSQIRALPRHQLTGGSSLLGRECQICMSEYEEEEEVMTLPCLHIYHIACVERWLLRKPTCPVCLTRIDADTQESDA